MKWLNTILLILEILQIVSEPAIKVFKKLKTKKDVQQTEEPTEDKPDS